MHLSQFHGNNEVFLLKCVHHDLFKYIEIIPVSYLVTLVRLALFSIQQTDLMSFSEDERGVKWLCN